MANSSFDGKFVIPAHAVPDFLRGLENPIKVQCAKRDYDTENKLAVAMLKKRFADGTI